MITFVYCCICLLIVCHQSISIQTTDYGSNYSPDTSSPEKENLKYRFGENIILKCKHQDDQLKKDDITWEFKHCNYKAVLCDDTEWKKLDYNRRRKKLKIYNATEETIGHYRCLYNKSVMKEFSLELTFDTGISNYGNNNYSPDISPEKQYLRYPFGADIVIKCKHQYVHPKKEDITWEFKHCANNKGDQCVYSEWKKLDYNSRREKLLISNASAENVGLYRCLYSDSLLKEFTLDVVSGNLRVYHDKTPPKVVSLISSADSAVLPNTPLVIQCKVSCVTEPLIVWFKEGIGQICDMQYGGHFYCPIPSSNDVYHISNNTYVSKLTIYRSHSIHSGTYVCLVVSEDGSDFKNITITVENSDLDEETRIAFWWLFLVPLSLLLVPVIIWLCFYRRKKNHRNRLNERKKLIQTAVKVDIV